MMQYQAYFAKLRNLMVAMLAVLTLSLLISTDISFAADAKVKAAQEALIKLGYDPGDPDGAWGSGSRKALNEFQKANGFKTTKNLNAGMHDALSLMAGGAKKIEKLLTEDRVGKTLVSAQWKVYYSPEGKKIVKSKRGIRTAKWYKKDDGTYCEYVFAAKKDDCGGEFELKFVIFNQDNRYVYFRPSGKKAFDFELVEGNKF